MKLNLRNITDYPARVKLDMSASELALSYIGVVAAEETRIELEVIRSENIYYCQGTAVCNVTLECSRCLDPYAITLSGEVEFSVQEVHDGSPIRTDDLPENELLISTGLADVDISQPVREALILEIPLKPLCRDDCLGLCPHCGSNRNETHCTCRVETSDSRWDDLRRFLTLDRKPENLKG